MSPKQNMFGKNKADSKPRRTQTNENTYLEFVLAQFYTHTSCKAVHTQMTYSSISEVVSVATLSCTWTFQHHLLVQRLQEMKFL